MTGSSSDQASGRRLLNATAVMASGTLISKVLGFVKASLLVIVLGASTPQADAYSLATLVPNTLYMIFAGGALNTVLVPQIVRHINQDEDRGEAFVNRIMTAFLLVLAAITALALVFTPQVMSLWTASTWRTPELAPHWSKLVLLAFLTMPQLFFYGAFFLIGQVLNARDKFGPMMWAPILNNVVGIGVLGAYAWVWGTNINHEVPFSTSQVVLLGVGSTLGIIVQTIALIPFMRSVGFRYRPRFDLKGTGLGATFHLAKWMLGYVLLTTLVQIVVQKLASGATIAEAGYPGAGVAAYNTANLVWLLPHSLLTVSLATAMLPSASRLAVAGDYAGVASETMRTMRLANTFLVPASIGFLVLGGAFSKLAFGHGAATYQWVYIAWTLNMFAFGLVPFTIQYVYLRGYYALEDTRTPFFIQIAISGSNVVLALLLVAMENEPATVAPRLALAYTLSYTIGAVLTHFVLKRRLPNLSGKALLRHLLALFIAAVPGAIAAFVIQLVFPQSDTPNALAGFLGGSVALLLIFLIVARRLRISEIAQVVSILMRRGRQPVAEAEAPVASSPATVEDQPSLVYSDPLAGHDAEVEPAEEWPESDVGAGDVLDDRYRLDELLGSRGGTMTWRGFDLLLGRAVLIHVMAPGDPRTLQILDEARTAAPAVDSRFLRIWDAVLVEDDTHGSYVVCEYTPGYTLDVLLRQGPLPPIEAAWLVGQVAEGLAGMHAVGLYHRRLTPESVVVTTGGNIKVVGFLVEAALQPASDRSLSGEAADVRALGELLYCSLVGRWPRGSGYGMPAAPHDAQGRPLLPRQVNASVPVPVSEVADRTLNDPPISRGQPITTASELASALRRVTGGVDASPDLERRMRFPLTPLPFADLPFVEEDPAPPASTGEWRHQRGPEESGPVTSQDEDTAGYQVDFGDGSPATMPFTPIPPPTAPVRAVADDGIISPTFGAQSRPQKPIRRRWMGVLAILFGITLVAGMAGVFAGQFERSRTPQPPPGFPAYAIHSVRDFDPKADGGDNEENSDLAGQAIDGRRSTAWTTERYGKTAEFNDAKPGAGLIVDLGAPMEVGRVRVDLGSGATAGEIRIPKDATATAPPLKTVKDWTRVAAIPMSSGETTVSLDEPVTTRFVLVYLTSLPDRGSYFQGSISSIEVAPPA